MEEELRPAEVSALINLLEDNENEVWNAVADKIMDFGPVIVPSLEKAWEISLNVKFQERLENIIQEIQFRYVCQELRNWDLMGGSDLFKGACIIAKFQYPELNSDKLLESIKQIKDNIWIDLNDNLTALEKVKVLNHILYTTNKFSGNFSNYYSPQNYYINQVLETRKGNPVSLGIVYITLARMLDLPVYGINLPKNFILAYTDVFANDSKDNILFYINPYNKGAVLGKREIDYFLNQQKIEPIDTYYNPCTNFDIIERLIFNLVNSYESLGQQEKVEKFQKLLGIIQKK